MEERMRYGTYGELAEWAADEEDREKILEDEEQMYYDEVVKGAEA